MVNLRIYFFYQKKKVKYSCFQAKTGTNITVRCGETTCFISMLLVEHTRRNLWKVRGPIVM